MNKVYARINWENVPSTKTALGATNLNRTDYAINEIDNRVIKLDSEKADKTQIQNLVSGWTMDENTGIITVTKANGERLIFDLNIEKIPISFTLSESGILTMTTADGTKFKANIGAMIPVLQFQGTDTIAVTSAGSGINKTYSFSVKNGSITEEKLQTNFLSEIKVQSANASAAATAAADSAKAASASANAASQKAEESSSSALLSESHSHGNTGIRQGENTDNSKYYSDRSKSSADTSKLYLGKVEEAGNAAIEKIKDVLDVNEPILINDLATGHLRYEGGAYDFSVNKDNGHLEYISRPGFQMDLETGHLFYQIGNFIFAVNKNNGHLEWEMAV